MPHQRVLPDLKEIADRLKEEAQSSEYLLGAYQTLITLIADLEKKGY